MKTYKEIHDFVVKCHTANCYCKWNSRQFIQFSIWSFFLFGMWYSIAITGINWQWYCSMQKGVPSTCGTRMNLPLHLSGTWWMPNEHFWTWGLVLDVSAFKMLNMDQEIVWRCYFYYVTPLKLLSLIAFQRTSWSQGQSWLWSKEPFTASTKLPNSNSGSEWMLCTTLTQMWTDDIDEDTTTGFWKSLSMSFSKKGRCKTAED